MSGTASLPLVGPDEDLPTDLFRQPPRIPTAVNCSGVMPPLTYPAECSGVLPYPVYVAYPGTQVEVPSYGRAYGLGDPYRVGDTVVGRVMSPPDNLGRVRLHLDRPMALNKNDVLSLQVSMGCR